jgi:hypothetical protein
MVIMISSQETLWENRIMKKIAISSLLILTLTLTILSACGGGGGGGVTLTQPTSAVLTLSTAVTGTIPATTTINSYNVTITLPAGVTVKSTVNPPETDAGVVTASGKASGALVSGVYTAATSTLPGTVKVYVASASGFDAGEFCKVNGDIAAGYYPTASSFAQPTLDDATGFDSNSSSTVLHMQTLMSLTETAVIN